MQNTLTWSSGLQVGSVIKNGEVHQLEAKPELEFQYESLYFEPDLNRYLKDINIPLSKDEISKIAAWIEAYNPPVEIVEEPENVAEEPLVDMNKAVAKGLLYASKDLYPSLSEAEQAILLQRRLDLKTMAAPVDPELEAMVKGWFLSSLTTDEIIEEYKAYKNSSNG